MLRAGILIAHAFLLLRCLFSAEARQELRVYIQNTPYWVLTLNLLGALLGLALMGFILVMCWYSALIFYHLFTTGQAVP